MWWLPACCTFDWCRNYPFLPSSFGLAADQLITCIVSVFLTTAFNLAAVESICCSPRLTNERTEDTRSMIQAGNWAYSF